jgi:hypothetical protein
MRIRSFLMVMALTVVLAVAAIYSVAKTDKTDAERVSGEKMFPDLQKGLADLAWMRLSHGSDKIDFAAIGGKWAVVDKGNYPAAPAKVRRLLLGLADLTLLEAKTQRPELFARLNLDDPATGKGTSVQLQDRLGVPVVDLIVGKARRDRLGGAYDAVYVRKPGENRTWLARGSIDVSGTSIHWLDRRIIDIPPSRIASVTISDGDIAPLVLKRANPSADFAVVNPPPDTQLKSGKQLAGPAGALTALELDDVKPIADAPSPDAGGQTATFETFDGLTIAARLTVRDNVYWTTLTVTGTGGAESEAKSLAVSLGHWAFALPADRVGLMRTKLSDLVLPAKGS